MQRVHDTVRHVDGLEALRRKTASLGPSTLAAVITLDDSLGRGRQHCGPVGCLLCRHGNLCNDRLDKHPSTMTSLVCRMDTSAERQPVCTH